MDKITKWENVVAGLYRVSERGIPNRQFYVKTYVGSGGVMVAKNEFLSRVFLLNELIFLQLLRKDEDPMHILARTLKQTRAHMADKLTVINMRLAAKPLSTSTVAHYQEFRDTYAAIIGFLDATIPEIDIDAQDRQTQEYLNAG